MQGTRDILISAEKQTQLFQLDEKTRQALRRLYLEMYRDIYTFCEKHHLCCILGGGSALGAVRHQGFIPWDDDLDLNMPRKDYDRFITLFTREFPDKYELFVPDGRHRITNLFLKVSLKGTLVEDIYTAANPVKTGVTIDIFPIEDVPSNRFLRNLKGFCSDLFGYAAVSAYIFQNRSTAMRALYSGSTSGKINYMLRCFIGVCMSFRKYPWWYQRFNHFVQCSSESEYCTVPTGRGHYRKELRKKEVFYPLRETTFETLKAWIPNQADLYLQQLYGDYMTLPPEEKQEKHFYTNIKINVD